MTVVVQAGTCSSQCPLPCLVHIWPSINTRKMKEDLVLGLAHHPKGSLPLLQGLWPQRVVHLHSLLSPCSDFPSYTFTEALLLDHLLCLWPILPPVQSLFAPRVSFGIPHTETAIQAFPAGPEQGSGCFSTVWCVGPRLVRHSEAISFCTSAEESKSKGDVSEHSRLIRCSQRQLPGLEAFAKTHEKLHSGGCHQWCATEMGNGTTRGLRTINKVSGRLRHRGSLSSGA